MPTCRRASFEKIRSPCGCFPESLALASAVYDTSSFVFAKNPEVKITLFVVDAGRILVL
jgi:hypothetical protein